MTRAHDWGSVRPQRLCAVVAAVASLSRAVDVRAEPPPAPPGVDVAGIGEEEVAEDRDETSTSSSTQPPWRGAPYLSIHYSTAMTLGSSSDFVRQFSFAGFRARMAYFLLDALDVGASLGFNWLNDKQRTTEATDTVALTATQIRSLSSLSMLVVSDYHIRLSRGGIRAYLGGGLGAFRTKRTRDLGFLTSEVHGWHFGVAPELGVLFPLGDNTITVGTEVDYVVKSSDSPEELLMTFNIGLGTVYL